MIFKRKQLKINITDIVLITGRNKQTGPGRNGMSILIALIIVSTLIMLASLGLKISSDESDITVCNLYELQAGFAAESGLMHAAETLSGDSSFNSIIKGTLEVFLNENSAGAENTNYAETEFDEKRYSFYEAKVTVNREKNTGKIISTGRYMGISKQTAVEIFSISPLKLKKKITLYEGNAL